MAPHDLQSNRNQENSANHFHPASPRLADAAVSDLLRQLPESRLGLLARPGRAEAPEDAVAAAIGRANRPREDGGGGPRLN